MTSKPGKSLLLLFPCLSSLLGGWHSAAAIDANANPTPASTPARLAERGTPQAFELGGVRVDKKRRTVTFPATINQRTGIVEYAVVTVSGKTHESVFRTEVQPTHIHLAMLLLGVKAADTNQFPTNLSIPPPGDAVALEVSWKEGRRQIRRPLEDFIITGDTHNPLARGIWVYNGSYLSRRTLVAQRDGSIISVHIDPDALVNNPRPGRENDDLHHVNSMALPAEDLPLEITLYLPLPALASKAP